MSVRRRDEIEARSGVDRARMAREGTGSIVYTLLVLAAFGMVGAFSLKFNQSWDFSTQGRNSLSPQTLDALRRLETDVDVKAMFTAKQRNREDYWQLLQRYRDASPHVRVEFIDPIARPGAVKDLGLDLTDEAARRDGASVVVRGGRKLVFRGIKEEDVTNAILEVGSEKPRVVGFIRGFGEAEPESAGDTGLKQIVDSLRSEYYSAKDVVLSKGIPTDVTLLIAVGPRVAIPPAELETLSRWLSDGGRLLALLEGGRDGGLAPVLKPWGLELETRSVLDPRENLNGQPEFLRITDFTQHAVVRGFGKQLPVALPIATAVRHFEPEDPKIFHDTLFHSSRFSESADAEGKRSQGPFDLGAAAWEDLGGGKETRVVLIGDADFPSNAYQAVAANRNLFLNCIGWLSRAEGRVSIRTQPLGGQTVELGAMGVRGIFLVLFGAPLLVVLVGVVVFLRRRGL